MAHLIEFQGRRPRIAEDVFLAPTAVLIGDVEVQSGSSIWFGAVLRADFAPILIGPGTSVQDNCVIHTASELPTLVGTNVTVGHLCMLEGCVIEDGALIGMNATVLNRARVGAGSVIAAGSVVREGAHIPPGVLAAGVPAEVKRELNEELRERTRYAAREYQHLWRRYKQAAEE
jgi:carbonic anhydrase/acetyltransferase-like protein (isoleucine patch superfamily)